MHELLLFASVPAHQHYELLQQLAGLTAMQPRHRLERRLVYKAYRKPGLINTRVGASQDLQGNEMQRLNKMLNGGMFYTQVVGAVSETDFGAQSSAALSGNPDAAMSGTDSQEKNEGHYYNYENQHWKLEFRDIPEAGTRSAVTTRLMASVSLPKGDIATPMNAWGYRLVNDESMSWVGLFDCVY
jgi:mediator of RNA polymerase II transcription subunit 18